MAVDAPVELVLLIAPTVELLIGDEVTAPPVVPPAVLTET